VQGLERHAEIILRWRSESSGRVTDQRIGIVPDIVLEPTIRGIQAGVDELLDRAIQVINR
jgi:hypothetical protein